jgi:hypothetical protein
MKSTARLRQLMSSYSKNLKTDPGTFEWFHGGRPLLSDQTPIDLEFRTGGEYNVIEVRERGEERPILHACTAPHFGLFLVFRV